MPTRYADLRAAVLLVHVVSMSEEEWECHDEVTMVAEVCGWDEARASAAVRKAYAQAHLMPENKEPTDADLAEMLLTMAAREPPGLQLERLLAFLRRWSVERARATLSEAARAGLIEWVLLS